LRAAVHKYRLRFRQAEDHYAQASVSIPLSSPVFAFWLILIFPQAIVYLSNSRAHLVKRSVDLQQSRSLYQDELQLLQKSATIKQQLASAVQ